MASQVGGQSDAPFSQGDSLYERGLFEDAIRLWKQEALSFAKKKDSDALAEALIRQASACHQLGQHKLALSLLREASGAAATASNPRCLVEVKALHGLVCAFSREADEAEPLLREALQMARKQKDAGLADTILNNLGSVLLSRGEVVEAAACFEEVIARAGTREPRALVVKAHRNLAEAALVSGDFLRTQRETERVVVLAKELPEGHDRAFLLLGAGHLFQQLFISGDHDNRLRMAALKAVQSAALTAELLGDKRTLSLALGRQGALYEFEGRLDEAARLTRRALALAQQVEAPDAIYRWQWQMGRILAKQKQSEAAIGFYRVAVFSLQTIRNDLAIRYGNQNARSSFRETVGDLYYELADLLLQKAGKLENASDRQALLLEARDTAELLKAAELEDYFQDDCVNLLKSKKRKIDSLSKTAAVVYFIPLSDRTEVLLSLPSGEIVQVKADISDERLKEIIRKFRLNLEDRTTNEYLEQAQLLYGYLIRPLEPFMASQHCDTMVFVPDGALRTIPMAALHDGVQFLVEKYAVAVTPGLDLMESQTTPQNQTRVMIGGLSEAVQGFAPLIHVPEEIHNLETLYPQSGPLMNHVFLRASLSDKLMKGEYSIVHIASHGHFDKDIRKSFVLTYDSKLTLDDLERCIRPAQLRDQPLDMLALSACQTAAGDDRAALGLAGVAVKAGARSAFATLWFVNDQASTELVGEFYKRLLGAPIRNKALALQAAQKGLLQQERYRHPCYWAPYLIIGNWL